MNVVYDKNMNSRVYIGLIVPFVPENPVKLMEKMRSCLFELCDHYWKIGERTAGSRILLMYL